VSLGAAIFAFLAAGTFRSIEEAQDRICPPHRLFEPDISEQRIYDQLYEFYRKIYFEFGQRQEGSFGQLLPALIKISTSQTRASAHGRLGDSNLSALSST
jgi:L-ribulokinase